jgi:hypothetical protein
MDKIGPNDMSIIFDSNPNFINSRFVKHNIAATGQTYIVFDGTE